MSDETNDTQGLGGLRNLQTEGRNPNTVAMDTLAPGDLVAVLHHENYVVADAVERVLPKIGQAIEAIAERMSKGGRVFHIGAGTSGRIGVLDASECPPTFGVEPGLFVGIIAGGDTALRSSIEGAEDDPAQGAADLKSHNLTELDSVIGIAASGRTPYVIGALQAAKRAGAFTVAVVNVSPSEMEREAELTIAAVTGPEALTGSTRLKAGTAQKMVLNLISTGVMTLRGKTYGNLMVDVRATNEKLRDRAIRIVMEAGETDRKRAEEALLESDWNAKTAIVSVKLNIPVSEAEKRLADSGGFVRKALQES